MKVVFLTFLLLLVPVSSYADPVDEQMCVDHAKETKEESDNIRRLTIRAALDSIQRARGTVTEAQEDCIADYVRDLWDLLDTFCANDPVDIIGYIIKAQRTNEAYVACHVANSPK